MIKTLKAKRAAETVLTAINFADQLAANTMLTGTPTFNELYGTDLTVSSAAIDTTGTLELDWDPVASGKAVTFLLAGGTAGTDYTLRISVSTDDSQTLMREISFKVN